MSAVPSIPVAGDLHAFRAAYQGESIVVCGCGSSLHELKDPGRFVTIGVNDVGRLFDPTYLVVVNPRQQFTSDRFTHIERSGARALFTQLELGRVRPPVVRFKLGKYGGTDMGAGDVLHYTQNSPYVAVCLAAYMGATRIGLIGVDFTDDHFFGRSGRHPLLGRLQEIDAQYGRLAAALAERGVELVNLSTRSKLTSLPQVSLADWVSDKAVDAQPPAAAVTASPRVFFVHYRFLSCGTVFETGLREAAQALGITAEHAYWDEPALEQRLARFDADLLFVVHGRRFVQRFSRRFPARRSAVWLVDEPYEVDDTASWSSRFDFVFTNDASTLARHRNAHELQVAYAPCLHHPGPVDSRPRKVGFVGGANPSRTRLLTGLARRGLLDHVVGGPWHDAVLGPLTLAANLPAERTAELYRETRIVVNVFRDQHHYNRQRIPATSMNPRIPEALACGALVISEPRSGLSTLVPELPTFTNEAEAAALVEHFLSDTAAREQLQTQCASRLAHATYQQRLDTVMSIVFARDAIRDATASPASIEGWEDTLGVTTSSSDGTITIEPGKVRGPASERGLVSIDSLHDAELTFEVKIEPGACLIAKLRLEERMNPWSNSYHLHAERHSVFLARHDHVLKSLAPVGNGWTRWRMACRSDELSVWRDDVLVARLHDRLLKCGHAFIGAQGGSLRVRGLSLLTPSTVQAGRASTDDAIEWTEPRQSAQPRLSIVTTVYDRCDCLRSCIASVRKLEFDDYEHLIVADHPPLDTMEQLKEIVTAASDPRISLYELKARANNWGIAPAAAGLRRARGEYLAFLSDDNGYTPDHFAPLIEALDRQPALGFVYSSCRYDGRMLLNHSVPRPGRIDLGQPLFRRSLFEEHFGNTLPFDMMAWDWHLVEALMRRGVRWRHVDRPSFIFRLAKYPELIPA